MQEVTITSIYLFFFFFFNSKLFLDLCVCLNVSMPLFSCKDLQRWPPLVEVAGGHSCCQCVPLSAPSGAGWRACDRQREAGQSCFSVFTLKARVFH